MRVDGGCHGLGAGSWGWGWVSVLMGTGFPSGVMKFWPQMGVMAAQHREHTECHCTVPVTVVQTVSFRYGLPQ